MEPVIQGRKPGGEALSALRASVARLPRWAGPLRLSLGLRARLLTLVGLSLLPAVGLSLYTARQQRQQTVAQFQTNLMQVARLVETQQACLIESTRHLLAALSRLPEVRGRDAAACDRLLAGLLRDSPLYANLGVARTSGEVWSSALPFRSPVLVADRAFFQHALQSADFAVGDYQIGVNGGRSTLNFGYPVVNDQDRIQSIVFASLDVGCLCRAAATADLPPGTSLLMVNRRGQVVARYPDHERWVGKQVSDAPVVRTIVEHIEGTVEARGIDGTPLICAFLPLRGGPDENVFLGVSVPAETAYALLNGHMLRNLLGQMGVIFIVLAAAWFMSDLVFLKRLVSEQTQGADVLNRMSELLQTCQMLQEAYPVVCNTLKQILPDSDGILFIVNPSGRLEAAAGWGRHAALSTAAGMFPPEDCWALRRGRLHEVTPEAPEMVCKHLGSPPPPGYVCIPMVGQGDTVGVLHMCNHEGRLDLPEAKRRLAKSAAHQAAIALANLRLRETLRVQSIRDPLTGLFNRRYAEETLARELEIASRGQRTLGVMLIDLDWFKQFNDTFGHDGGDVLLRELGTILKAGVREGDIPCRYGGEEFLVILPDASLDETKQRAEELRDKIKHLNFAYHGKLLGKASISVGVAAYPAHGKDPDALFQATDAALYRAKNGGRDRVEVAT